MPRSSRPIAEASASTKRRFVLDLRRLAHESNRRQERMEGTREQGQAEPALQVEVVQAELAVQDLERAGNNLENAVIDMGRNQQNEHVEEGEQDGEQDEDEAGGRDVEEDRYAEEPGNDESDEGEPEEGPEVDDAVFGNNPLYANAFVTVRESAAAVVAFMMNHNLSVSCLSDLLTLIQLHCPPDNLVKLSVYKLKKYHNFGHDAVNKVYYCSVCQEGLATPQDICGVCMRRSSVSYFTQIPLLPQIQTLFQRHGFYDSLQARFTRPNGNDGCLKDIYDGALYREHQDSGFLARSHHVSMTYYTDGVPVFKSKNYSFWGFFLTINELPYRDRIKRENTILAALWCGSKPNTNLFLYSIKEELRTLFHGSRMKVRDLGGFRLIRGVLLMGTADLQAKCSLLNCVAHNGFFGCLVCEQQGETFRLGEKSTVHVYRYQWPVQKRTVQRMIIQATEALAGRVRNAKFNVVGVRGPTTLRLIMPDFVRGTAIDFMHLIMGVVKKFFELLFEPKYEGEGFSLTAVKYVVDSMLLKIKPPRFVHRLPRSLEDVCHWHASELKLWLFYYSVPILKGVMRPLYFQNYLKLVIGLSYLSSSSISEPMIAMAEQLLHSFVEEFQQLYGLRHLTINFHNLLHVADCVRDLGPAWVYSCFPYEDLNGRLLRVLHGTTNVDSQIIRMHSQILDFPKRMEQLPEGVIKDFCQQSGGQLKIAERLNPSCYVVGTFSERENDRVILQALRNSNIACQTYYVFYRLLKDRLLYVAETYQRHTKTLSSYAAFVAGNQVSYGLIHKFVRVHKCLLDNCPCEKKYYAIIKNLEKVDEFHMPMRRDMNLKHLHRCRLTLEVSAVPVENLRTVCFFITAHNSMYLGEPLNPYEVE